MNSIQGVSTYAIREGFLEAGIMDGDVLIFSELMDSRSLFLTANADTVYFLSFIDLSAGPLVLETPSDSLGIVDDMWFGWVTDFGLPGPDRGQGGQYLLLPPGYEGALPEGGYYVRRSSTNHIILLGRAFIDHNEGNDPGPTASRIKEQLKIYPFVAGGVGSSIGGYLTKGGPLGQLATAKSPRFVEGTGRAMNTLPPNDFGHYEMLDALVQMEPAEALNTELAGQFAAIGIVKGEKFDPDQRLRAILDEAVAVGNAASRTLGMGAHPTDTFRHYDGDTAWWSMLFVGGYDFINPPPMITADGVEPYPNKGRAPTALAHVVLLLSNRNHPGDVHAADQCRIPVPHGQRRPRWSSIRWFEDLQVGPAQRHPCRQVLVADPVRQPDSLDAADPAALPEGRQPELSVPGRRDRVGRVDGDLLRTNLAGRGCCGQLDPDRPRARLVRRTPPVQPARSRSSTRPGGQARSNQSASSSR